METLIAKPKTKELEKLIYHPMVKHQVIETIKVARIINEEDMTRIDFICSASPIYDNGGWVQMDSATFIRPVGTNQKLTLIKSVNIPLAPTRCVNHKYKNKYIYI